MSNVNTGLWLPRDEANTLLWLDGSDPAATGITPANGSAVSSWKDKSSAGLNFLQATGANQPVNANNFRNGLNTITFVTSQYLDSAALNLTSGFTCVIAFQLSSNTSCVFFDPTSSVTPEFVLGYNSVNGKISGSVWDGSTDHGIISTSVSIGTFYIVTYSYDTTNGAQMWLNLVSVGTAVSGGYNSAGSFARRVGQNLSLARPFNGNMGDLILLSGFITAPQRNQMETYCKHKWNV